jgi:transcription elongation factor GreA
MNKYFIKKEPRIPFTQEGFDKIIKEKAKLMSERPEAVEHLRKAREMGDLSENGYYKASRQKLNFLDAQIRRVDRLLKLAIIVESQNNGKLDLGSSVIISNGKQEFEYSIVGGYESDPSKKTISYLSPLGRALMGKKEKDEVIINAPAGPVRYSIIKIK